MDVRMGASGVQPKVTTFALADIPLQSGNDLSAVVLNPAQFLFQILTVGRQHTLIFELSCTTTDAANGGFVLRYTTPALQAALNPAHDVITVGSCPIAAPFMIVIENSPDPVQGDMTFGLVSGASFPLVCNIFGQLVFTQ